MITSSLKLGMDHIKQYSGSYWRLYTCILKLKSKKQKFLWFVEWQQNKLHIRRIFVYELVVNMAPLKRSYDMRSLLFPCFWLNWIHVPTVGSAALFFGLLKLDSKKKMHKQWKHGQGTPPRQSTRRSKTSQYPRMLLGYVGVESGKPRHDGNWTWQEGAKNDFKYTN